MNDSLQQFEPAYGLGQSCTNYLLKELPATVTISGIKFKGNCKVKLEMQRKAAIRLYGEFKKVPEAYGIPVSMGESLESFSINGYDIPGFRTSGHYNLVSNELTITWCPSHNSVSISEQEKKHISHAFCHLFNFLDVSGSRKFPYQKNGYRGRIDHIDLDTYHWKIELKSLGKTQEIIRSLNEEGGYQLTHAGRIQKLDGSAFSGNELSDCLTMLTFLLSFARGCWCNPVCSVGIDRASDVVLESWSVPRESWKPHVGWLSAQNDTQLPSFASSFSKKWSNEDWRETLRETIYWYLNANDSSQGIDTGIILAQAAIEKLSYQYVVIEKRLILREGFRSLVASDKFRILMSSLKIPIDIPTESRDITNIANDKIWLDAPHALTDIRNALIHPERGSFSFSDNLDSFYQAWKLSLWYLELSILAVCEYKGTFYNRLKDGYESDAEEVPWILSKSPSA